MRGTVVGGGGSGTDCPQAITPSITMAHTPASTNRFRFCNLASCCSCYPVYMVALQRPLKGISDLTKISIFIKVISDFKFGVLLGEYIPVRSPDCEIGTRQRRSHGLYEYGVCF